MSGLKEVPVVDVWYEGYKYQVPRGEAPGWGLRIFFDVPQTHELYVLDSTVSLKKLIDYETVYYVSHWDRFYKINNSDRFGPKDNNRNRSPRVVHMKSGVTPDIYIGPPTMWVPKDKKILKESDKYREWLEGQPDLMEKARKILKGKVLGTWHAPDPGYGDVLLEIANAELGSE